MTKRRLAGILAGLILLAAVSVALVPRAEAATVVRVIDGDTLVANIDGREETIRLLNIDTPETKHPSKSTQCLGEEAAQWLTDRLPPGTTIDLAFDKEKNDRYGRLLAAIYESDALVNAEIADLGLGIPVTFGTNSKFREEVQAAHESAKNAERGLFDPQVECTVPAKVHSIEQLTQDIAELDSGGNPGAALEEATAILEEIEAAAAELEPQALQLSGLALYRGQTLGSYAADARSSVEVLRGAAKSEVTTLKSAKTKWDAEQERLRQEEAQREAERREAELEAQELEAERERQAQQQERENQQAQRERQVSPQPATQAPAPAPTPQQPAAPRTQAPAPQPTAPAAPTPPKKTSCTPYGPEIPYSNDGGYTGLRYGMPGGHAFRKCS